MAKQGHINGKPADMAELDAGKLTVTPCTHPRPVPELDSPEVWAQNTATDHMITCKWTSTHGWHPPHLEPYGPLSLMPTASALHYATECFEGMKAYRGFDGKLRLFRPAKNCERMRKSASRVALPSFSAGELEKLIRKIVAVDGPKWLSAETRRGSFLYLRPTMIATAPALGVQRPREALLYVIAVMMPSYDSGWGGPESNNAAAAATEEEMKKTSNPQLKPDTDAGMKLLASDPNMCRAWPGGFGNAKVGGNYGPTLVAQGEARARGFDQVLWLFGEDCQVTEAGGSNFFVVWKTAEGVRQLVTAPLGDGLILEGVVRGSVLEYARERLSGSGPGSGDGTDEGLEVVERKYTMDEVVKASEDGRLLEAFGSGTAVSSSFPLRRKHLIRFECRVECPVTNRSKLDTFVVLYLSSINYSFPWQRHSPASCVWA